VQGFRELNKKSMMDKYTMKDMHECIGDIGQAELTIFSTLDLTSGFGQMPLNRDSVQKTAFTLPGLGQDEWVISPIGLLGCWVSFQRLIEKLMDKISNFMVYMIDLHIHSQTHGQYLDTIEILIQRLKENHIQINPAICFGKGKLVFWVSD
jgi:putative transposase